MADAEGRAEDAEGANYPVGRRVKLFCGNYYKSLIIIFAPIILLPIIVLNNLDPKFNCMYVVALMATFWITEVIPINITAFIPMVLFPLLGIMNTKATCMEYLSDTNIMCLGSLIFARAIEYCNLHNRLAYFILTRVGCSHYKLHAGFAVVTSFVSMWITNMAATAMMCPIVMAILKELESEGLSKVYKNRIVAGPDANINDPELTDDPQPTKLTVGYYLILTYASTIGGTATLIGTGTHMTAKGIYESLYPQTDMSFLLWMMVWLPPMIMTVALVEFGSQVQYLGLLRPKSQDAKTCKITPEAQRSVQEIINRKYAELGSMTWHEIVVLSLFLAMVVLFFMRSPGFMPGYYVLFNKHLDPKEQKGFVKDAASVMLLVLLMFFLPRTLECCNFFRKNPRTLPRKAGEAIINWKYLAAKLPWGFVFVLGSGFVLAKGGKESGMNVYVGEKLNAFSGMHPNMLILVCMIFAKVLTEFITNLAVASLTLPILASMATNVLKIHPLNLMMPVTISCSHAFMLPVGTPGNALVREYAGVTTPSMVIGGLWPSFVGLFLNWILFITYGKLITPELKTFPDWARPTTLAPNTTTAATILATFTEALTATT